MTVYLTVWHDFSGKQIGVLEMRYNVMGEEVVQTYEFIGNGTSDGGSWEWTSGTAPVEAHLTSNLRKTKIGILRSKNWGKVNPPADPWFEDPKETDGNKLDYFDLTGASRRCSWFLKK